MVDRRTGDSVVRISGEQDFFIDANDQAAFGLTDRGQVREVNQDQFLVALLSKSMAVSSTSLPIDTESPLYGNLQGQLLLVADGMGGHAAGEKASSLAINALVRQLLQGVHWFLNVDDESENEFIGNLKELVRNSHQRILKESAKRIDRRGMGTTLTMAYIVWPRLFVVHAGDSRCYRVRQGTVRQLTNDHTLARQMVEAGGLDPEDEAESKWSHVLWNVLGGRNDGVELLTDVTKDDLVEGDTIVVCSDGLHRYVNQDQLATVIDEESSPEAICRRLIEMANVAGGEDNITVVVAQPQPVGTAQSQSIDQNVTTTWSIDSADSASLDTAADEHKLDETLPG